MTIGGPPAKIVYAGTLGAYANWSVLQLDAVVPRGLASGPQPVVLKIGSHDNSGQSVVVLAAVFVLLVHFVPFS